MNASVSVFAPGSVGNIGPGLDILGMAVTGAGDTVTATATGKRGVSILASGHPDLPTDPGGHASGLAARAVLARVGQLDRGITLEVRKGLPLSGGQGGARHRPSLRRWR